MYAKRVQILNNGPIDHVDVEFPFNGENPKPVLLVGENGSGKSIFLSHIINGLMGMQSAVYPENSEVEKGKVYRIRFASYIKPGSEFYWGKVNFEEDWYCEELQLKRAKKHFSAKPESLTEESANQLWESISSEGGSQHVGVVKNVDDVKTIEKFFENNCILYFPHNRFEEPAWLNEVNLKTKAQYMDLNHMQGYTDRKIINYSPLRDNQNWLFEVLYDQYAFEFDTRRLPFNINDEKGNPHTVPLPLFFGHQGVATTIYDTILNIVRQIFRIDEQLRFGIGKRQNRMVSLMKDDQVFVPNIFQLSSGETSLMNLFLSILRDFDLANAPFTKVEDVRGIVIIDEIDLHLHSIHQYEVLPGLIKMFPRVQFIVTTHSPLFVLGMEQTFGQDGFALYRLPLGQHISPEEFSEFGNAYKSFSETRTFSDDMQQAIMDAGKPIVFVEGKTDITYLQKAAKLLEREDILEKIEVMDGGGWGNLDKIWRFFDSNLADIVALPTVVLLYDCEKQHCEGKSKMLRRSIPLQGKHPLQKGIENLFEKMTLNRALADNPAYIDIVKKHTKIVRGKKTPIPELWTVNKDEKTNLCNWLCENGTQGDFKHFSLIFDLLDEALR